MLIRALGAATLLWAASLPLAAAAVARGGAAVGLTIVVYGFGGALCHQRPERSFHWSTVPWPVCARCTGIYLGAALAAACAQWVRLTPVDPRRARWWCVMSALPLLVSLLYEWTTGVTPSNATRAATGAIVGAVVAVIVLSFLSPALPHPPPTPQIDEVN